MRVDEIKKCFDYEILEQEQSKAYRDRVDINNCGLCFHKHSDGECDLDVLTKQIMKVDKLN